MLTILRLVLSSLCVIVSGASFPAAVHQAPIDDCEAKKSYYSSYENAPIPALFAVSELWRIIDCNRDDISAVSTLIIAAFTTILGIFTISLARSTRKAADSAAEASNALLETERGVIVEFIRNINPVAVYWATTFDNSPTMPPVECDIRLALCFKNYGKTPATLHDIELDIVIGDSIPKVAFTKEYNYILSERTLAQNDQRGPIDVVRAFEISWQTSRDLYGGQLKIYFIGAIIYKDVFENLWRRQFIWEYVRTVGACLLRHEETHRHKGALDFSRSPETPSRTIPLVGRIQYSDHAAPKR